ncbi:MAG: hypothetical protein E7160_03360 [Firmicutes bacterium]|nr:hypothetical protein [Bacillota bacterium]
MCKISDARLNQLLKYSHEVEKEEKIYFQKKLFINGFLKSIPVSVMLFLSIYYVIDSLFVAALLSLWWYFFKSFTACSCYFKSKKCLYRVDDTLFDISLDNYETSTNYLFIFKGQRKLLCTITNPVEIYDSKSDVTKYYIVNHELVVVYSGNVLKRMIRTIKKEKL